MTIKHTAASLFAAALLTTGAGAFAGETAQSFGRDGGTLRWMQGAPLTGDDTQRATQSSSDATAYGRAGRLSGLEGGPRDASPVAAMPDWPGRQGRVLTIDDMRG